MSKSVVFISDFFVEDITGGGELNDYEIYKIITNRGYNTKRINSHLFSQDEIEENVFYVVSNFINLKDDVKSRLQKHRYILYEHDHKYVRSRNPALYKNFIAPPEEIINQDFYKKAQAVLCQSNFHKDIIQKNIHLENLINVSGNAWSLETLEFIRTISKVEKEDRTSILRSNIYHKNTSGAIDYCIRKNEKYDLISDNNYHNFLSKMGSNRKFVFIPKTPETLSRICVEARMMNMSVVTNGLIGASKEDWYSYKGEKLIDHMIQKREDIANTIIGLINE